jgi:hypothetical protein
MCNARDAIATISFVAVAEIENGFDGRGTSNRQGVRVCAGIGLVNVQC